MMSIGQLPVASLGRVYFGPKLHRSTFRYISSNYRYRYLYLTSSNVGENTRGR